MQFMCTKKIFHYFFPQVINDTPRIIIKIPMPCIRVIFSFKNKQEPIRTKVFTRATDRGIANVRLSLLIKYNHNKKLNP